MIEGDLIDISLCSRRQQTTALTVGVYKSKVKIEKKGVVAGVKRGFKGFSEQSLKGFRTI